MTPEQALQLLDQVTAQVSGSRELHTKIQEALTTLKKVITSDGDKNG